MNTQNKLADALRALVASVEFTPLGAGPLHHLGAARAALAEHDETPAPAWTADDEVAANAEGWCVSNCIDGGDEIQRLDEAERFSEDVSAIAWVYWNATAGSALHRKALAYTLRDDNRCRSPSPRPETRT